mgnify:FL=1
MRREMISKIYTTNYVGLRLGNLYKGSPIKVSKGVIWSICERLIAKEINLFIAGFGTISFPVK